MKWKTLYKKIKIKYILSIIGILASLRILISLIALYFNMLEKCFNKEYITIIPNNILDCLKTIHSNKIVGVIYVIIVVIFVFLVFNIYFTKKQLKNEREGISFKEKDGTHGTANFIKPQDIKELSIGDEEQVNGIVIGKTLETDELIVLPDECTSINRNIMVWGASGSRKVYEFYNSEFFKNCRPRRKNKRC